MTHTIKVIAGGFVLLALCLLIGRLVGGAAPAAGVASAAQLFIPLWRWLPASICGSGSRRRGTRSQKRRPFFSSSLPSQPRSRS
jgi:hypothetical protein